MVPTGDEPVETAEAILHGRLPSSFTVRPTSRLVSDDTALMPHCIPAGEEPAPTE